MAFDGTRKNTAANTVHASILPNRQGVGHCSLGFTAALFVFVVIVSALADVGHESPLFDAARTTPHGDKLCHFAIFGALAFFAHRALGFRTLVVFGFRIPVAPLLVLTLATVEELSQAFFPQRTLDVVDWLSDLCGITTFSWLSQRLGRSN